MIGSALCLSAFAQASPQASVASSGPTPLFSVNEVSRTIQAVNYRHRSGATNVDFAGTALLPSADGTAKVRSKRGTMEVEAEFGRLQSPSTFGGEYLTYILWAISPEGRPVNLGEVLVGDNNRSKLTATTDLQAFALIVTAEPYFAVRQPSNVVVLENIVRDDTKGSTEAVNAKYELMERDTPLLKTPMKMRPSKRGSRVFRASAHVWRSSSILFLINKIAQVQRPGWRFSDLAPFGCDPPETVLFNQSRRPRAASNR